MAFLVVWLIGDVTNLVGMYKFPNAAELSIMLCVLFNQTQVAVRKSSARKNVVVDRPLKFLLPRRAPS